jgi:hypothetical protein
LISFITPEEEFSDAEALGSRLTGECAMNLLHRLRLDLLDPCSGDPEQGGDLGVSEATRAVGCLFE